MRYMGLVLGLTGALLAGTAHAQLQNDENTVGTEYLPMDIELTLGVGLAWGPEYSGGGDYEAILSPLFSLDYKDALWANLTADRTYNAIFADKPHGIGFNIIKADADGFSAGISLLPEFGRNDSDAARIRGLGDIDWTVLGGGYVKYNHGPYFAMAQLHQDLLNEHDGYKGELSIGGTHLYNRQLRGTVKGFLGYGSDNYNEAYYGVTTAQSASSAQGLSAYTAESGFNEIGVAGNLTYALTPGTFIRGFAQWTTLIGDASDSSVVKDENQMLLGTTVGYRF